jgi:sugar phosphate isomerase/epimerase
MKAIVIALVLLCSSALAAAPEFFAFDNAVGRGKWTAEQQATILKELGYDGISYNYTKPADLAVWLKTFKAHGLKIYGLYVHTFPDKDPPYDPAFKDAVKMLKGTDTVIWMTLREVKDKKRSYDAEAMRIINDLADQAGENGLRVAVYPHAGFYVECAADAVRMARLVNRPNVGASLNLCHEFLSRHGDQLDETIKLAAPVATLMSINGMDVAHKNYLGRIDQGDFDLAGFLKKIRAAGYKGPIGLQGYRVPGDPAENLRLSMEAWKRLRPQ